MGFRYDIQGLRALAVLLVFIFHLNTSWLTGGFIGVDIFFVISGFLVSGIILHKKEKNQFYFLDFYFGRIKRIVPVFLLLLIFVGIVGAWVYLSGDIQGLRKNIFWSSIFNSNNYLASLDNYFGASSQENPLLHTWTLSIEMQFYFLLPLFLIFINKKYILPISILIVVLLLSYSFYNSTYLNSKSSMYFSLIARIPEFLIGTIFAVKADYIKDKIGRNQNLLSFLSLIGIVFCGVFYSEAFNFPGLWVVLPCMFTGILLMTNDSKVNAFISNRLFVHIGELSYSIYLWHWAIMAFIRYYYVRIEFSWYEMLGVIVITYLFSLLSYTYIEKVFRNYTNKKFLINFSILISTLGIIFFIVPKVNTYLSPIPELYSKPVFGLSSHGKTFKAFDFLGDISKSNDSILLIGDSHALVYKRILDVSGNSYNYNFKTITNDLYPNIPNLDKEDFKSLFYYEQYENLMFETEKLIKESRIIIISSIWSKSIPSLKFAFEDFVKNLNSDQHVIILSDYPVYDRNPLRLTRDILANNENFDIKEIKVEVPDYIEDVISQYSNVHYLKLDYSEFQYLPAINDTLAYYDDGHMNYYGTSKVGEFFSKDIYKFLKKIKDE